MLRFNRVSSGSKAFNHQVRIRVTHAAMHAAAPCAAPSAAPRPQVTLHATRRALLIIPPLIGGLVASFDSRADEAVEITSDQKGSGSHAATDGDLLLIHYVGSLESGVVFDSTRGGGLTYRDGGEGVFRPAVVQLGSSNPTPGIVKGLREGLYGMTVGGKRTLVVRPLAGFGGQVVGAPYAIVPSDSILRYEVELLRLSSKGPDELTRGIARCGAGGASASSEACGSIEIKEFV